MQFVITDKESESVMQYLNCYPAVWENVTSKKSLKEAIAEKGDDFEVRVESFDSSGYMSIRELSPSQELICTNHPKRSWFANIIRTADGKITVK